MGAWGTSLYANDTASDIRGDYVDLLKRGKSNQEAVTIMVNKNQEIFGDVEEEPLFWYALADTQWNYGRLLPFVKEKALYFLSQKDELERWKESGEKQTQKWIATLDKLRQKLESEQPPEKKVSKYRLYKCKWDLGDVFAYRFTNEHSRAKGFIDKYVFFRKVSEDIWWPGHIIPVVQFYNVISPDIPSIDFFIDRDYLPAFIDYSKNKSMSGGMEFKVDLITESEKELNRQQVVRIGNIQGDDLIPFQGVDYYTGYMSVGWETSKYNHKIEERFTEVFKWWNEVS